MLTRDFWQTERDEARWSKAVLRAFGAGYRVEMNADDPPIVIDLDTGIEWIVAPPGSLTREVRASPCVSFVHRAD